MLIALDSTTIDYSQKVTSQPASVYAAVFAAAGLGLAMFGIVVAVEMFVMLLVPIALALFGAKKAMVVGLIALLLRVYSGRRPDEILAFAREWDDRCPLVIVPTKYYATPTEVFEQAGVSMVIWTS